IEYTYNGKQFQIAKNVKKIYLQFDEWSRINKVEKNERSKKLVELFLINVNAIMNALDILPDDPYLTKKINLYSGVLESFNAFFSYQQNQYTIGELAGLSNYTDRNKKLNDFFNGNYNNILIKELNAVVWDDFRGFLKRLNIANSSINQYITYVKSWYNWLVNYHEVPTINHANKLKKLDTSKQIKKYKDLDSHVVAEFFETVATSDKWLRLELITRLIGENTVRPVQVRNIQAKHIDLSGNSIKLYDKKSKRWRTIIFTPRVKTLIERIYANTIVRQLTVEADDYLIGGFNCFKRGRPYSQNMMKDMIIIPFRKEFEQFKSVNVYDFKHTSITKASKLGNLLEVQKRAGHSKITTTQIYDRSEAVSNPISIEELISI
ncbi:MAG: site-specific integrase, partial [Flavobacterium sp.]